MHYRACSPKPLLQASEIGIGLIGASSLRDMTVRGGERIIGRGVQERFGRGEGF